MIQTIEAVRQSTEIDLGGDWVDCICYDENETGGGSKLILVQLNMCPLDCNETE